MRLHSFSSCLSSVIGRPSTVVCCFRPVGRRPVTISLRSQKSSLEVRTRVLLEIVQSSQLVATLGAPITELGRLIAALGRSRPRGRRFVAHRRHDVTILG
jgi:hypothetical protein